MSCRVFFQRGTKTLQQAEGVEFSSKIESRLKSAKIKTKSETAFQGGGSLQSTLVGEGLDGGFEF